MTMKQSIIIFILSLFPFIGWAQTTTVPSADPVVEYTAKEDGTEKSVSGGDSFSEEAPLHIECRSQMSDTDGYTVYYEWKLSKISGGAENLMVRRNDQDTSFDINDTGTYSVRFSYTYLLNGVEVDVNDLDPITFTIPESSLTCPDGISPNDDGWNDYLIVTCKSIVKLEAVIFNRWGKKVASTNMAQAQSHEQSSGNKLCVWDGHINGKVAKDGVYFINLVAQGSDGVAYKIKKAINVLKGFTTEEETDGTSE